MVLTESMVVTHGSLQRAPGRCALTIGNFDGVHRGHRALIERVTAKARELELVSCVLTFEPHPREFFDPQAAPARLTRLRDKLELIEAAGVERVHVARFDRRFASLSPERFVDEVLVNGLATRWLLVGRDFRFGARATSRRSRRRARATDSRSSRCPTSCPTERGCRARQYVPRSPPASSTPPSDCSGIR